MTLFSIRERKIEFDINFDNHVVSLLHNRFYTKMSTRKNKKNVTFVKRGHLCFRHKKEQILQYYILLLSLQRYSLDDMIKLSHSV